MIPNQIMHYLPLILPLLIIQLALLVASLIHILKHDTYKIGNRVVWIIICVCVNLIGPILYFILGRSNE